MDHLFRLKTWRRLFSCQYDINAIYYINFAFFLDAYAFSSEGVIGFTIGRKNKNSFLSVVENSIQLKFITALIISLFYLIFLSK